MTTNEREPTMSDLAECARCGEPTPYILCGTCEERDHHEGGTSHE